MVKKNIKHEVIILASIVILSLIIYPNAITGKQIGTSPIKCTDYYYPPDCEAVNCVWNEELGCIDNISALELKCSGLSFLRCIFTKDCNWDLSRRMCITQPTFSIVEKSCNTNLECPSDFCDYIPSAIYNNYNPTFKCKNCQKITTTVSDNLQNCGESGIDCGPDSYSCSCYNGIKDIGEDYIDCNYYTTIDPVCETCLFDPVSGQWYPPHCFDILLDYGENCIDCGGSCSFIPEKEGPDCCVDKMACNHSGYYWCESELTCVKIQNDCQSGSGSACSDTETWCETKQQCWPNSVYEQRKEECTSVHKT